MLISSLCERSPVVPITRPPQGHILRSRSKEPNCLVHRNAQVCLGQPPVSIYIYICLYIYFYFIHIHTTYLYIFTRGTLGCHPHDYRDFTEEAPGTTGGGMAGNFVWEFLSVLTRKTQSSVGICYRKII